MRKVIFFAIVLVALICGASYAYYDYGFGVGSKTVVVAGSCGVGYDTLTGSNSVEIHDSLGSVICCPQ